MPAIVASTEVDRPAAEVFAYATDPARFSEWQRAWWKGTWMILPTAPARLPWARAAR
jgi:uncharacterized protein YndB with AHSA1/START domain